MEALQRLHNRGSISTGYDIDNSLKLESDNNEHLYVTTMTSGNRRTWTYSIWFKRTELGFTNVLIHFGVNNQGTRMMIDDTDQLFVDIADTGSTLYRSITNRLFRDTSAWYHVVLRVDTTQSTEADRMRVYINGVEETSWAQHQIPTQNLDTLANTTVGAYDAMGIGTYVWAGSNYDGQFSGYISQVAHVDGQSYAATEFGEFDDDTGIWKPKDITGLTYGSSNNSFLLDFSNSADLGNDSSGNNNDWSLSNITAADQATDTPTNNFTTFNTLRRYNQGWVSFKEGATNVITGSGNNWTTMFNTMAVNKGKWYFEGEVYSNEITQMFGQQPQAWTELNVHTDWYLGGNADKTKGAAYYCSGDDVYYEGGYVNSSASTGGDIISVAMDCDNNKVHFAVNGVYTNSSDPANNTNGFAMLDDYQYFATAIFPGSATWKYNFGGYTTISISSAASDADGYGTFEYAPPSGYYALCTKNLEEYG